MEQLPDIPKRYTKDVKDIIEEYNNRLQSWGNSDSWGLTEFRMLEDLIYESSKIRINANTLKRFFQQRTSNPQIATYNALCVFLGYSSYADFVLKKTQQEQDQEKGQNQDNDLESIEVGSADSKSVDAEIPSPSQERGSHGRFPILHKKKTAYSGIAIIVVVLVAGILFAVANYWDAIKEKRENYLFSKVVFEATETKGLSPYTLKVKYDIPSELMDSVYLMSIEANGDATTRKIENNAGELFATFIYSGKSFCQLRYKDRIIKTIEVESRTKGWSAYLREDRSGFYQALPFASVQTENGYINLPADKIPPNADTDKLFVSYTYYTDSIIDGDNIIFEAKVRNSKDLDHGIHCYDIMMYIFSNTAFHGFALNEGCYSYLKFISSEKSISGSQHNLSNINFDPAAWHIMRIEVIDKKTTFYLDGKVVLKMDYNVSLGTVNELTLRFKGCGAVDYVKVLDPKNKNKEVLFDEFDN